MDFDSIKQMEFFSISEGTLQYPSHGDAYITISDDRIDITKSISIELGYPNFVFIGTNGNAIGIKPVNKSEGALKVCRNNKNLRVCGVDYISRLTARIASMHDVNLRSHYIRVPLDRKEEGYLIFDAGQMMVIEKKKRS